MTRMLRAFEAEAPGLTMVLTPYGGDLTKIVDRGSAWDAAGCAQPPRGQNGSFGRRKPT